MTLSFISLSSAKDLTLGNPETEPTYSLIYELSLIMSEEIKDNDGVPAILIRTFHQNTAELREKIELLIAKYSQFNIKIMQLRGYFQQLKEDEYFAFCRAEDVTEARRDDITIKLIALRDGQPLKELKTQLEESVGGVQQVYNIKGKATNFIQRIGEPDKTKRVCRFCKRSEPEVSFKNIAHAIAESLGNKTLILNEECDSCNWNFGSDTGIEKSLITFLKPFITIFGLSGKRGVPKLRGEDFGIEFLDSKKKDNAKTEKLETPEEHGTDSTKGEDAFFDGKFNGTFKANLIWQNLYRTLCKYVLSIMDTSELAAYEKTIAWINREFDAPALPKIAILQDFAFFSKQPSIMYYVRKDSDSQLPYTVAEFHQTMFTFIFIIPFAKLDTQDFTSPDEYNHYWQTFKHFSEVKGWRFQDASNPHSSEYKVHLNFEQPKKDSPDDADELPS